MIQIDNIPGDVTGTSAETLSRNRPPRLTQDHYPYMFQIRGFEQAVERNRLREHHGGASISDAVLAEISLRSPRKIFIFVMKKKYIFRIKVSRDSK